MSGGGGGSNTAAILQQQEEERKAAYRARLNKMFGVGDDPEAVAARQQFELEEKDLTDATRGKLTTDLGDRYARAERENRFREADAGTLGGSSYLDQKAELERDFTKGTDDITMAVNRALGNLRSGRESARSNAMAMIQSGAGDAAQAAAASQIRNAVDVAKSANLENNFENFFTNIARGKVLADQNARGLQAAQYYGQRAPMVTGGASRTQNGQPIF